MASNKPSSLTATTSSTAKALAPLVLSSLLLSTIAIAHPAASSFEAASGHEGASIVGHDEGASSTGWLRRANEVARALNALAADVAWRSSTGDGGGASAEEALRVDAMRAEARRELCGGGDGNREDSGDVVHRRRCHPQLRRLCSGPEYDEGEMKKLNSLLQRMQSIYTDTHVCAPRNASLKFASYEVQISNLLQHTEGQVVIFGENLRGDDNLLCLSGEPEMERIMATSRIEPVLEFCWSAWRDAVGPPIRSIYAEIVQIKNDAARRAGYSDVGQAWREELGIDDLAGLFDALYQQVERLYESLHSIAALSLERHYGGGKRHSGLTEAHLTGNMWSQNWASILDIVLPRLPDDMDLNRVIEKRTEWTPLDMAKRAEDFYTSMGLAPMTEKFWKHSYFGKGNRTDGDELKCHGTAANMFVDQDYRMIYCAGNTLDDFYVIHHEMGHIEYYMSYDADLPTLFQEGANSAIEESIGDAIMLGVMSPQHLQRLGLIPDRYLYTARRNRASDSGEHAHVTFDDVLILYQALNKIPQIPFGYLFEKYRWGIFSGEIESRDYNKAFWEYSMEYQRILPPKGVHRGEHYFDAAAKFHFADDTPYARYFIGSFVQMQIFKGLCQWTLLGAVDPEQSLPIPLHRCDLYGSRKAGKKLKEAMSKGSSIDWSEFLYIVTGDRKISSRALLEYFEPLTGFLNRLKNNSKLSYV